MFLTRLFLRFDFNMDKAFYFPNKFLALQFIWWIIQMSKIIKKSLAEEIADKLREQITGGQYKVNDKLPTEPELMAEFGVGRSSIREATKSLVQSGILRIQQGAGTFVERSNTNPEPMDVRMKRAH